LLKLIPFWLGNSAERKAPHLNFSKLFYVTPLFPVYEYGNLENYHVWEVPLAYICSYTTKAWGALILAFLLDGCISVFVPREKMVKYLSSERTSSYFIAAGFAPVLTVCSCAMIPIFGGIMIAGAGIGPGISFLLMAPAAGLAFMIGGPMASIRAVLPQSGKGGREFKDPVSQFRGRLDGFIIARYLANLEGLSRNPAVGHDHIVF